jgi:hypothetical protein
MAEFEFDDILEISDTFLGFLESLYANGFYWGGPPYDEHEE